MKEANGTIGVRTKYLDVLRVLSCVLVVMVHVSGLNFSSIPVTDISWHITSCFDMIGILGVPLFMMISGALLLKPDYEISGKKLAVKTMHIAFLYFFWMFFYNLEAYLAAGGGVHWAGLREHVILRTLSCVGMYHLWFLPALMALYLATPLLRQIVKDKKVSFYFMVLAFIMRILFPTAFKFNFRYQVIVESIYNTLPLGLLTDYAFYYVLGHYLDEYAPGLTRRKKMLAAAGAVLGIAITAVLCSWDALRTGSASVLFNDPFTPGMMLSSICIFLLAKGVNKRGNRLLSELSHVSLGIYLLHPACLLIVTGLGLHSLGLPVVVQIPLLVLLVFSICAAVTWLLSKIPFVNKCVL